MDTIAYIFNRLGMGAIQSLAAKARVYHYLKKDEEEILKRQIDVSARIAEVYNK